MELTKPKISVIVPTYKTAKYLPKCLDSIHGILFRNKGISLGISAEKMRGNR